MILVLLLLFAVVLLAVILVVMHINTPKRLDHIPGPKPLPIFGNYFTLMKHNANRLALFQHWNHVYGDIYHISNFNRNFVFLNDPNLIQHVLQNNFRNYIRFPQNPAFDRLFGEGIFHSNGDAWKFHREIARPLFKTSSIDHMAQIFESRSHIVLEILSDLCTKSMSAPSSVQSIDVQNLFMRYTLDSIGLIGFGVDIGSLKQPERCAFAQHFDSAQRVIEAAAGNPLLRLLPNPTFDRNIKYLDEFVYDIVRKRKEELKENPLEEVGERSDLLTRYMVLKDEQGKPLLSESYLRDAVLNFFIAGRDTTGILLTWTFYLLAKHPEEKEKLLEEIRRTESEKTGKERFDSKRLKEMKHLHNVLREALRMYPPVPMDGRTAVEDDVLPNGHHLPAGTNIFFCSIILHQTEKYWGPDAALFRPSRWEGVEEGVDGTGFHAFQFIPFHGGPQTCLGQNMAYREAKILTCQVISEFDFWLDETHVVRPRKSIVLPAENGVKLFFRKRGGATA